MEMSGVERKLNQCLNILNGWGAFFNPFAFNDRSIIKVDGAGWDRGISIIRLF